jgi:hypothetical protein
MTHQTSRISSTSYLIEKLAGKAVAKAEIAGEDLAEAFTPSASS